MSGIAVIFKGLVSTNLIPNRMIFIVAENDYLRVTDAIDVVGSLEVEGELEIV